MNRREPLPSSFGTSFLVRDARVAGIARSRLRADDLRMPTHGVRSPARDGHDRSSPVRHHDARRAELLGIVQDTAPALRPPQFFSHETALAIVGSPLPMWPYTPSVHVSAHRPAGMPRRREWVGHRLQARPAAVRIFDGVPVESPVRAWRQVGRSWSLVDLVAAADFLVHPRRRLATVEELAAEIGALGDMRDRLLARALGLVRPGAESPEETSLRLLLGRAGLPEASVNFTLRTPSDRFVARLDLAYLAYRVAVEYDGRVHAENAEQFRRDADRWEAIRAEGWHLVRILSHHVRPNPEVAVRRVRIALQEAGWSPPPPRP
ncbi:endonuclease domain-containing protein [Microbacterium insulae]|uniref:Endonuclease domain-containing protein n=1 Tax=Microbacterium insulae TaxID=483014 RepID=A0ABW3AFM2_9MICO